MNWLALKKVTSVLLFVLALALMADIVVLAFFEYGLKSQEFIGCYAYDAMLMGFDCQGFPGSALVSAWLNWPPSIVYAPLFSLFSIRALSFALLVWLPILGYIFSAVKLGRSSEI